MILFNTNLDMLTIVFLINAPSMKNATVSPFQEV